MKEIDAIITSYENAQKKGEKTVLATVVHVEGSSYRAAGARMLIDEFGFMTGAISGGCLEGDAMRKALLSMDQNMNKLVTYDTSDEDDAIIGAQLGCNGIIHVLFEPLDPSDEFNPVELLKQAVRLDQPAALVSLFNLEKSKKQPGTTHLIDAYGNCTGHQIHAELLEKIKESAKDILVRRVHHFGEYQSAFGTQNAFIQLIAPPPTLVLVGAGNDAQVLSKMADVLGWNIVVVDGRPTHANKNRFNSCQVIVTNPEKILDNIRIHESTAFVLMTHNYNYDLAVLKLLLNLDQVSYIGILGPNKKYQRMLDDMKSEGILLTEEQSARIFAPVGLQLGAETPAEIGLSILSEIQAVITGSRIHHLREIDGPIHNKELYAFKTIRY